MTPPRFRHPSAAVAARRPAAGARSRGVVWALIGLLVAPAVAEGALGINFGSTANADNRRSDGADMDVTFTFELGVFQDGFTPSEENIELWTANWRALPDGSGGPASAVYDPSPIFEGAPFRINNFEGTAMIEANADDPLTPFLPGTPAYIWGFTARDREGVAEWILILNDSWRLPRVTATDIPSTLDWAVSDPGTTALLGSVNPLFATSGDDPHLQSAEVVLTASPTIPEPAIPALLGLASLVLLATTTRRRPARPRS